MSTTGNTSTVFLSNISLCNHHGPMYATIFIETFTPTQTPPLKYLELVLRVSKELPSSGAGANLSFHSAGIGAFQQNHRCFQSQDRRPSEYHNVSGPHTQQQTSFCRFHIAPWLHGRCQSRRPSLHSPACGLISQPHFPPSPACPSR